MQFLAGGCLNSYFRMSSVKNMTDSIFFTSHIYMTLAILCRRRHKVAIIAELNLKFSSRFLRQRNACGLEISVKTGGLEVGTGNDTIVEENEKAGMADGCFLCSVCAGADLF